jgi:oxalate decarboxylase
MVNPTRRTVLAGAVALGATAASAQEQPVEGKRGAPILGPHNAARESQNPDILRPPETDSGGIPNLHFAFADAHVKMREGGWSREVTQREMPIATTIAGVNMRLTAGGVRELHWHKPDEWAFMLAGKARITALDKDGHNFVDDVGPGDLWYFPSGIPHSIQGLSPEGTEFLYELPIRATFPSRQILLQRWSRFSRGTCARFIGTRMPTSGSTTSLERRA